MKRKPERLTFHAYTLLLTIEVQSKCKNLVAEIIEQDISDMHVSVPGRSISYQMFTQFKDPYGLLEN